ncbi:MAG TPA: esterase-like activity of phytase family protein [Desulfuromonadaceae bacterium]|nr:esterase-like activity of phytase family protein [Desulfuromonadaceae bacterium]
MRARSKTVLVAVLFTTTVSCSHAQRATLEATYTLPRMTLAQFGNPAITETVLAKAKANGLNFTDLPSIGSGLAVAGPNEFFGITDRGPNGQAASEDDPKAKRTFPLPSFCPSITRFTLTNGEIKITQVIPYTDTKGQLISGLSNVKGDERLYESAGAEQPIPLDPNGIDPEAIRVFPDGKFLISEEYSPSILVVATNGRVLMRYTPTSKSIDGATYPVKAILPDIFAQRRPNKGFENLALSKDGKVAYAILQSPIGDVNREPVGGKYSIPIAESRAIRAVKLDVSDPLNAKVIGEYFVEASLARDYSAKQKQEKISWSDADWMAPDKLLVIERGKSQVKLLEVDFSKATNLLERKDGSNPMFDEPSTILPTFGIRTAETREIFSTADVGITSTKIEGIAILGPTEIALSNDNDFGIGDNVTGEPSRVWIVRLKKPLDLATNAVAGK